MRTIFTPEISTPATLQPEALSVNFNKKDYFYLVCLSQEILTPS